eukprot:TRINITY_DN7803_c0_g1_i1.p1 TRINITY_DN7803_c0_g1~~TRINITY_DN7803_c0_g1_i1.p1  ORF type:complete len:1432 (+),score=150.09 TRINITY_DN7803_c0_g1_i1:32-4327(+)
MFASVGRLPSSLPDDVDVDSLDEYNVVYRHRAYLAKQVRSLRQQLDASNETLRQHQSNTEAVIASLKRELHLLQVNRIVDAKTAVFRSLRELRSQITGQQLRPKEVVQLVDAALSHEIATALTSPELMDPQSAMWHEALISKQLELNAYVMELHDTKREHAEQVQQVLRKVERASQEVPSAFKAKLAELSNAAQILRLDLADIRAATLQATQLFGSEEAGRLQALTRALARQIDAAPNLQRQLSVDDLSIVLSPKERAGPHEMVVAVADMHEAESYALKFPNLFANSVARTYRNLLQQEASKYNAQELKSEKTLLHFVFYSVLDAVMWACQCQVGMMSQKWPAVEEFTLPVRDPEGNVVFLGPRIRMGLHLGKPHPPNTMDLRTLPVQIAARLCHSAAPGDILIGKELATRLSADTDLLSRLTDLPIEMPLPAKGKVFHPEVEFSQHTYSLLPQRLGGRRLLWDGQREPKDLQRENSVRKMSFSLASNRSVRNMSTSLLLGMHIDALPLTLHSKASPRHRSISHPFDAPGFRASTVKHADACVNTERSIPPSLNQLAEPESASPTSPLRKAAPVAAPRAPPQATPAPVGQVAFAFFTVQGAARLWQTDPATMSACLEMYHALLHEKMKRFRGYEVQFTREYTLIAFGRATDAIELCLAMQLVLVDAGWPSQLYHLESDVNGVGSDPSVRWKGLRVCMSINSGQPIIAHDPLTDKTEYLGPVVSIASVLARCALPGTILCTGNFYDAISSFVTQLAVPATFVSLGKQAVPYPRTDPMELVMCVPASLHYRLANGAAAVQRAALVAESPLARVPIATRKLFVCAIIARNAPTTSQPGLPWQQQSHNWMRALLAEAGGTEVKTAPGALLAGFGIFSKAMTWVYDVLIEVQRVQPQALPAMAVHECVVKVHQDPLTQGPHFSGADLEIPLAMAGVAGSGEVLVNEDLAEAVIFEPDLTNRFSLNTHPPLAIHGRKEQMQICGLTAVALAASAVQPGIPVPNVPSSPGKIRRSITFAALPEGRAPSTAESGRRPIVKPAPMDGSESFSRLHLSVLRFFNFLRFFVAQAAAGKISMDNSGMPQYAKRAIQSAEKVGVEENQSVPEELQDTIVCRDEAVIRSFHRWLSTCLAAMRARLNMKRVVLGVIIRRFAKEGRPHEDPVYQSAISRALHLERLKEEVVSHLQHAASVRQAGGTRNEPGNQLPAAQVVRKLLPAPVGPVVPPTAPSSGLNPAAPRLQALDNVPKAPGSQPLLLVSAVHLQQHDVKPLTHPVPPAVGQPTSSNSRAHISAPPSPKHTPGGETTPQSPVTSPPRPRETVTRRSVNGPQPPQAPHAPPMPRNNFVMPLPSLSANPKPPQTQVQSGPRNNRKATLSDNSTVANGDNLGLHGNGTGQRRGLSLSLNALGVAPDAALAEITAPPRLSGSTSLPSLLGTKLH